MHVTHHSRQPLIVVGHGSSGTSIFCNSVRKYLRISFGTETQFILRYYHRLHLYGDLSVDANLRRLIADISQERYFQRTEGVVGWKVDREAVFQQVPERSYRGVLESIFWQLARHNRMERWGDKGLQYERELDVIRGLFPDAKFLHMVRDGRDVALSVMGRYWGPKNIYTAACEWRDTVTQVDEFMQTLPESQRLVVRYEDFLARPVDEFRRLIAFLDVDDGNGSLLQFISENIAGDLKGDNWDKWRTRWTDSQRLAFERVACDVLRRFGYETRLAAPVPEAALARAWWAVDNKLRKYARADYWRDNAYRAGVRSRDLVAAVRLRLRRNEARNSVSISRNGGSEHESESHPPAANRGASPLKE